MLIAVAISVNLKTFHWFLLPLIAVSAVLSKDVVSWFEGTDIFSIRGVCGLFSYYFFVVSPLFYIAYEGKLANVFDNLPDWRDTIGYLSIVNCIGLLLFKAISNKIASAKIERVVIWVPSAKTKTRLIAAIIFTGIFTVITFVRYGGLAGLFNAFSGGEDADLSNASLYTIGSYPFPILVYFYLVFYRKNVLKNRFTAVLIFLAILLMQILISGAGGARGNFIYVLFWAVVVYHYLVKKIDRKTILVAAVPMILLLWVFSFYKSLKMQAFDRISAGESLTSIADDSNRGLESLFWGDMSRISIHAYMFNKLQGSSGYSLRMGKTYLESVYPIIPFWIWKDRPVSSGKIIAGTELLWGKGYYESGTRFFSSNAYGITGEAALNFGVIGFIFGFILWGVLVGLMRRYYRTLNFVLPDYRVLIYPFLLWWSFNLLLWDSDNYWGHNLTKSLLLLLILNWLFSKRKLIVKSQ